MDIKRIAQVTAAAAFAATLWIPTGPIAAPLNSNLSFSEGVTLENVAWRGGGKRRGGKGGGGWGGGGKHGSFGGHGSWRGGGGKWGGGNGNWGGGGRKWSGGHGNWNRGHDGGKWGGNRHGNWGKHRGGRHNGHRRWDNWDGPFVNFGFGWGSDYWDDDYFYAPQYSYGDHVLRCEATYQSYDPSTDMYLGYDGNWHRCLL
jgi:hypothetical protein